jgi:hypothetical protein
MQYCICSYPPVQSHGEALAKGPLPLHVRPCGFSRDSVLCTCLWLCFILLRSEIHVLSLVRLSDPS